jgi:hypothetical protein
MHGCHFHVNRLKKRLKTGPERHRSLEYSPVDGSLKDGHGQLKGDFLQRPDFCVKKNQGQ